jgi:NAD(P)H-dependent nitrite reductase small subunit
MPEWVKIASKSELANGSGKVVAVGDQQVALFHLDGRFYAIDNTCPHRGGPLGEGELDGSVVTCPWHGWEFDITTGASPINPAACVKKFNVKAEGEDILIEVP